jgi:uroporphyrinogen III methyltransferase/synthase
LTLRGQELLRQADVVVYDHLVSPRLLRACAPGAQRIYVGKEADRHTASQERINRLLVRAARAGKTVVRLKGGDPFLFGRGGEEALTLRRAGVRYEVVPGVTSALAVPAYAGIPLTYRGLSSSVAIVTGHEDPAKPASAVRWDRLATACDTLVCLMGVAALPSIAAALIRHGRQPATPCALIERGTCPGQRTVTATLRAIAQAARASSIRPPAVLVVGDVVSLRRRLAWTEARPLFGARILVTRASDKAAALAGQLEALGAEVAQLPAIELAPAASNGLFRRAVLERMPSVDWVFFTSPEGIGWLSKMLRPYRKDLRWLAGCRIAAIGPKTAAALEERGLHVDFVPRRFSQEGMLRDFPRRIGRGRRALILSAERSRDVLAAGLRRLGMRVEKVPLYRTVAPRALREGIAAMGGRPFDCVAVTSASCVEHLAEALQAAGRGALFRRLRFASIGPITSAAVRARGGRVVIEARTSTIEGLIEALIKRASQTRCNVARYTIRSRP